MGRYYYRLGLKFYEDERKIYKKAFDTPINDNDIDKISKYIFNKYEVKEIPIIKKSNCRNFYYYKGKIKLSLPVLKGVLAHELAHHIEYIKTGKTKHYKPLMVLIGKVINDINKMELKNNV